jgi:hypothetical protein
MRGVARHVTNIEIESPWASLPATKKKRDIGYLAASITSAAMVEEAPMFVRLLSFGLLVGGSACGSDAASTSGSAKPSGDASPDGDMISCDNSKMGLCSEWRGLDAEQQKEAKASCNDPGAVFGSAACKTDKLLGKCEEKAEKITIFFYPSEVVKDVKDAKEMCDDGAFTEVKK